MIPGRMSAWAAHQAAGFKLSVVGQWCPICEKGLCSIPGNKIIRYKFLHRCLEYPGFGLPAGNEGKRQKRLREGKPVRRRWVNDVGQGKEHGPVMLARVKNAMGRCSVPCGGRCMLPVRLFKCIGAGGGRFDQSRCGKKVGGSVCGTLVGCFDDQGRFDEMQYNTFFEPRSGGQAS
jgi:hypothetical protein